MSVYSFNRYRLARLAINTPGDAKMWLDHLKAPGAHPAGSPTCHAGKVESIS
jgi:hypothetical protein